MDSRKVFEKVNELMVEDWVMYRGEPIIVFEIDYYCNRIDTEPDGYDSIRYINLSDIQPIPLTSKILEKNGFQQISTNKYISSEVTIAVFAEEFLITVKSENAMGMFTLKYVHELQHVLRLCGIDKKIEL